MRKTTVVSMMFLLGLGVALLWLSILRLETSAQIGHSDDPGPWRTLTVSLEEGQICRLGIVVDPSDIGHEYSLAINQVENSYRLVEMGGPVPAEVMPFGFEAPETGHYEIDWHDLNVSQITAYRIGDQIPKFPVSVGGFSFAMIGIISFLGFERGTQFRGEKTRIFWLGLIIFGLALTDLFSSLWWGFVLLFGPHYHPGSYVWPSAYVGPAVFAGAVFLLVGLYMMNQGLRKEEFLGNEMDEH